MLPFMKPRAVAGLIISQRKPDGSSEPTHQEGDEDHALEACADDLIRAVHSKDAKATASALRAAFQVCESEPDNDSQSDEGTEE